MIDTDCVPEFPAFFGKFFNDGPNIAGVWRIDEVHEFGSAFTELNLQQDGNLVSGFVTIYENMNDDTQMVVREEVVGEISEGCLSLRATAYQILQGRSMGWILDNWYGFIENDNFIRGYSEDDAGTQGSFILQRVA